ncbi:aromatic amino acid aminotransferase 1 [Patellaria atrata CBS 101060]|uniref:Aromatic amino acid aminotransferase 1 n=1 Tax=Patellaria atrata CBS 101060 TaxID=1346257 RepID=A0A9P4SEX3_9PEZI|nr:aromatic amino acid aminotransferase 1 [Patellaria atrata CBS 101060]
MSHQQPSPLHDPIDLSHHLSRSAKRREASSIKQFYKYFLIPGIGQLAGGLPNGNYFPYDTLEAKVSLPNRWKPTPLKPVDPPESDLAEASLSDEPPSSRMLVPHDSGNADPLRKIDLATALQYGTAQGYPPLYSFIRQFTKENLHPNVPYKGGPEVILTCGNTDGFAKTIAALNDEWSEGYDIKEDREAILCEEYAYMNAIQTVKPRGMNIAPVAVDDEGMKAYGPGGLQDILENWDSSTGKMPHLMYTVTIGQNPTGGTLSVQRRKEIYALCVEYDIIIVEDDPYWYLQFPSGNENRSLHTLEAGARSSGFPFLDSLIPSYLSVDYQGRVVRLDTFSKTVAPGCRLGWITAQPALIERILRITETSTQQPSGFVQSMIAELLMGPQGSNDPGRGGAKDGNGWKVDGWVRWLEGLRGNYERRMNIMADILNEGKYLIKTGRRNSLTAMTPSGNSQQEDDWAVVESIKIYDFVKPVGGMFIWVRFDFSSHPLQKKVQPARLARALWVFLTTKPYIVLVAPGTMFAPTDEIRNRDAWECFRLSFAAIDMEDLRPVSKRFVGAAQAFWRIKSKEKIEELLADEDVIQSKSLPEDTAILHGFC